ncbi:hypothetical protein RUM43_002096 [Polyplax serrata]|uniref:CDK5RAP1-like protein n=1 Tax=Polyplax serrata TaxID=468196 RepID=A0AAN8S5R6_POLSC
MKGLTRFCLGHKSLPLKKHNYHLWKEISPKCSFQLLRFHHGTTNRFDGPGLKDFLIKEHNTKQEKTFDVPTENVPYIDELDLSGKGQKVLFDVYGCQMNTSDTEIVLSILQKNGYERTLDVNTADIVFLVTCSIRESAEVTIWRKIEQLNALRKKSGKKHMKIGILGCMAERLKHKVMDISKAVDLVAGPDSYKDLPRLLALTENNQKAVNVLLSLDETYADVMPVRLNQNDVTAYISTMRGCDNMCTYCIVPFTRGKERSRPIESILEEVRVLSDQGVKQITLLGQNVNSYRDMSQSLYSNNLKEATKMSEGFKSVYKPKVGGLRFETLLDKVSQINPEMRIRFTSPHPKDFPIEVLHIIKDRKNICNNLHLPAQSGSNTVLERMRRGYTREAYLHLVEIVRSIIPNVTLTTDIISGFCGETEEDHEDTLDLIRKVEYNFIFKFPYSMREKTTAHRRFVDDVPKEVKIRRMTEITEEFRRISAKLNEAQINETQLILVEGFSKRSNEFLAGRNDGNIKVIIPDQDIPSGIGATDKVQIKPGDYVAVTITEANSQVLKGVPLYHATLQEFGESQGRENCRVEMKNSV